MDPAARPVNPQVGDRLRVRRRASPAASSSVSSDPSAPDDAELTGPAALDQRYQTAPSGRSQHPATALAPPAGRSGRRSRGRSGAGWSGPRVGVHDQQRRAVVKEGAVKVARQGDVQFGDNRRSRGPRCSNSSRPRRS